MFCLIWLLGGGMGDAEGAEAAGCVDLEDEEWLGGAEEAGVDRLLDEDEDDWLREVVSFCCCCFLGMVKLDLVTLSAPVAWIGPWGKGDGAWAGDGLGLLDFVAVLLGIVTGLLDALDREDWRDDFLLFGETLAPVAVRDFFPLTDVEETEEDFSGDTTGGAFSLCFSSLWGARNHKTRLC